MPEKFPVSFTLLSKTQCMFRFFILWVFAFTAIKCYGQTQLTLHSPSHSTLRIDDGWNGSLQHFANASQMVYLITQHQNQNNEIVVEVKSQPFLLMPGETRILPSQVSQAAVHYVGSDAKQVIQRTGYMPEGTYRICTQVIRADDASILAVNCFQQICMNAQQQNEMKGETKRNKLSTSGNMSLEQFYTPPAQRDNMSNNPYTRLQGQVGITAFELPFEAQIRLTTEKNLTRSQHQAISLSFDADEFKANLRKRLEDKIRQRDENNRISRAEDIAKLGELDNLKQLLSDTSLQRQLARRTGLQAKVNSMNIGQLRDSARNMANLPQQQESLKRLLMDYQAKHGQDTTRFNSHIDSLENKLLALESKRANLDTLKQQIDTYANWQQELKELSTKQEEYKKLKTRYDQLSQFKQELVSKNNLPQLATEDFSKNSSKEYLKARLQKEGMLNKTQKLLFDIEDLSIGTLYPQFSPLILSGMPVNGIGFSVTPGKLNASVVAGKLQTISYSPSMTSDSIPAQPATSSVKYQIISTKIGFGSSQGSHLFFNALHAKTETSQNPEHYRTRTPLSPVLGADVQFPLMREYVMVQTYVGYSRPNVYDTIQSPASGRENLAYQSTLMFGSKNRNTKVKLSTRYVGSRYQSVGAPFLRAGNTQYAINFEHVLWKRQLRATGAYSLDHTQITGEQIAFLLQRQSAGGIAMTIDKWPQIQINYRKVTQTGTESLFRMTTWQLMSNHTYKIGDWMSSNMLMYTLLNSKYNTMTSESINHQAQVSQTFRRSSFSLAFNLYYNHKVSSVLHTQIVTNPPFTIDYSYRDVSRFHRAGAECSVSLVLTDSFLVAAGIQLWHDPLQSYTIGERFQFTWQLSKLLQLQGRGQYNGTNIQPFFAEVVLKVVW